MKVREILEVYDDLAPHVIAASPERIVESALGRLEIATTIPKPNEKTAPGSHTHFLPKHIAQKRSMPVGMDIPEHYLPGAIFYPRN